MCGVHAACGLSNAALWAVPLLRDCSFGDLLHSLGKQSQAKLLQTASLCLIAALLAASAAFQTNVTVSAQTLLNHYKTYVTVKPNPYQTYIIVSSQTLLKPYQTVTKPTPIPYQTYVIVSA